MRLNLDRLAALTLGTSLMLVATPARAQDCHQMEFQEEGQLLLRRDADRFGYLDSDGNGLACEDLPSIGDLVDDPWTLPAPLLLGDRAQTVASYYDNVVLAGDTLRVQAFLDYFDLSTKWRRDYASAHRLWASCTELMGPGGERGSQMVCVAIDDGGRTLDDRVFSEDYTRQVASQVFEWD